MFMPRKTLGSKRCRRNHLTQGTSRFPTVDKIAHTSSVYKACKHLIVFFKDLHEQKHRFFLQTSKSWSVADTVSCLQIADLPFFGMFQFFKTAVKKRKQCLVNCRIQLCFWAARCTFTSPHHCRLSITEDQRRKFSRICSSNILRFTVSSKEINF